MNTTRRLARYIALPAVSAGVIGGAALGLSGTANASTYPCMIRHRAPASSPHRR